MASHPRRGERLDRPAELTQILARIHGELVDLGRCADELQITIGSIVVSRPSPLALDAQIGLQTTDVLSQRLERLAQLVGVLEVEIRGGRPLDGNLTLGHDLGQAVARLGGVSGGAPAGRSPEAEGDCDFF